jgi:hypothetical protein
MMESKSVLVASFVGAVLTVGSGQRLSAQGTIPDSQVEANVLKAMASAPELASQTITMNTVYGVVTLSGTVADETLRTKAETLAANAAGVKKVVDQLQLGTQTNGGNQPGPGMVLLSDGTYGPAIDDGSSAGAAQVPAGSPQPGTAPATGAVMNDPDHDQAALSQPANGQSQQGASAPAYPQYPQNGQQPQGAPRYPQGAYAQNGGGQPWGGQAAGHPVTIPEGTMVRIRVNRFIASDRVKPGDPFDGVIANDVVAGGFVAIPRGAAVQGKITDAKASGAIKGRGELSLELTSVTMGGKVYPINTHVVSEVGPDKTAETVNRAAGLGVMGAIIGAVAGRGTGAAIGAGAGVAAGVGASAANPHGQAIIPAEGMVAFNLAQPAKVETVSEQEMERLAYGVPAGQRQPMYGRPVPAYYPGYPAYPAYPTYPTYPPPGYPNN